MSTSSDVAAHNWKDAWRLALGGSYRFHRRWTARAGLAYATTPISDKTVTLDFPYDDYKVFSLGLSFQPVDSLILDLGAQYTLPFTHRLHMGSIGLAGNAATVEAEVETALYSAAFDVRWRF